MSHTTFPFNFDFLSITKLPEGNQQSAQEIWLAGLGAFSKAQKEGEKAFQTLVQDGLDMQKKNQEETQRKIAEATEKMTAFAGDMAAKASGNWGKLEGIFEDRVARALKQLGVPTQDELQALREEIQSLRAQLEALSGSAGGAPGPGVASDVGSDVVSDVVKGEPAARKKARVSPPSASSPAPVDAAAPRTTRKSRA